MCSLPSLEDILKTLKQFLNISLLHVLTLREGFAQMVWIEGMKDSRTQEIVMRDWGSFRQREALSC